MRLAGLARREFLNVDDCADACVHLMKTYSDAQHVNVGSGHDVTILELTKLICDIAGYDGGMTHDLEKPDGTPRKLMNSDRLKALGWSPVIDLETGLRSAYHWYVESHPSCE